MTTEAAIRYTEADDQAILYEVSPDELVKELAKEAEEDPGGPDARKLALMAITATESMHSAVFGEDSRPFPREMQLARDWSTGEKIDTDKLHEYWWELTREAYAPSFPIGAKETEIFSKEIKEETNISGPWNPRRPDTRDARIQARYVTGNLIQSILYMEPTYSGIHPSKPLWYPGAGANSLASIVNTDAAKVMSRHDGRKTHQQNINTQIGKVLANL